MLQWNLYEPGFAGAVKVLDAPAKMGWVSKAPPFADTVCAVSSAFFTVTIAPARTVIGVSKAKFLIVIVAGSEAVVVGPDAVVDDADERSAVVDVDVADEFELELQPARGTATMTIATSVNRAEQDNGGPFVSIQSILPSRLRRQTWIGDPF